MEIINDEYKVIYIQEKRTVKLSGEIRLRDTKNYTEIADLLQAAFDESDSSMVLDLKELNFLNSSGISTISKFVLHARKTNSTSKRIKCLGSDQIFWQKKTLPNLLKIWNKLILEFN